jgi:hypothetical protein
MGNDTPETTVTTLTSAPETEQLRAELDRLYDDHRRAYARVDEIEAEMSEVRARIRALGVHDVI